MKKRTVIVEGVDAEEFLNKLREIIIETIEKEHPPTAPMRDRLISLSETAGYFSVSPRSINNWCRYGHLSPVTIGRRVYFEEQEIQDLIKKNKTPRRDNNK